MAATGLIGPESSYTAISNLNVIRNIEPLITTIANQAYPLLRAVGFNSGGSVSNTKFEWQEGDVFPLAVYANGATGTGTSFTIQADTSGSSAVGYVKPGDVLMAESELMWVQAVENNTVYVKRGYASTTAVSHADNTKIYIIGNAQLEGSSPGRARWIGVTTPYNVTQIWREDAEVYGTEVGMDFYGVRGGQLLNERLAARMRELYQKMELALIYALRHVPTDNSEARVSGGIAQFVTGSYKVDLGGAALEESDIVDELEQIFQDAGMENVPTTLVGNTWPKRKITAWYRGLITTERAERIGGARIDRIETEFGVLDYMLDHLVKQDDLFILNLQHVTTRALGDRTLKEYDATIPGKDHIARTVFGEYGFQVKNPKLHRWLTNFSTTS